MIKFKLPKDISVGNGTLSCVIEDGGVLETASKTIPILLQSLNVKIYPVLFFSLNTFTGRRRFY
jgi:alpha-2-macroglobulin-like protein